MAALAGSIDMTPGYPPKTFPCRPAARQSAVEALPDGPDWTGRAAARSMQTSPLSGVPAPLPRPVRPTDTAAMAKHPTKPPGPAPLPTWTILYAASKAVWLGTIEAAEEATQIERAAEQFRAPAMKLVAIRR